MTQPSPQPELVLELSNPSDPYIFRASSKLVASLAIAVLGPYGASDREDKTVVPVLFTKASGEEWFREEFGIIGHEAVIASVLENAEDVAACLESFVIGGWRSYDEYHLAIKNITDPEKLKAYQDEWHDRKRSSMNNIGKVAKQLAEQIRSMKRNADLKSASKN